MTKPPTLLEDVMIMLPSAGKFLQGKTLSPMLRFVIATN